MVKSIDSALIYKERYETYRHLDKLRWYIFQIGITVVVSILALGKIEDKSIIGIGIILISTGVVMCRVNQGVDKNNLALAVVANTVGDNNIPDPSEKHQYQSVSWIMAYMLVLSGLIVLIVGGINVGCSKA